MKIANNKIQSKTKIDLQKLKSSVIPNDDIKRVVKKMLLSYKIESLPSIVQTLDLDGVTPSDLDVMRCNMIMTNYVSTNRTAKHPMYYLENVLEKEDVVFADTGISTKTVAVATKMGMLADDPMAYYAGAASTLLNYYTRESDKGIAKCFSMDEYANAMQVPNVDMVDVRSAVKTKVPSVTLSREIHYETIMREPHAGLLLMDKMYSLPKVNSYAVQNETVQKVVQKFSDDNALGHDSKGFVPSVVNNVFTLQNDLSLNNVWLLASVSKSQIGGDKAGRGSLTAGYYSFDMPANYVKAIARARELIAILGRMNLKTVKIAGTKEFTLLMLTILARNDIRVISPYGKFLCQKSSPPGIYATADVSYLNVVANSIAEPKFSGTGMNYPAKDTFESCFDGIFSKKRRERVAVLTYFTSQLIKIVAEKDGYSLFPTLSPHSGKIWVVNTKIENKITNDEHVQRFCRAVYHKNIYPLTRKPFFAIDELRSVFPDTIMIPKIIRAEKKNMVDTSKFSAAILDKTDAVKLDNNYQFLLPKEFKYDITEMWNNELDNI